MDVFLFAACSHAAATGTGGAGWTAVCLGRIAYGNAVRETATVAGAEAAAALEAVRAASAAFPGARRVLITTDAQEIQFVPWGALAEGVDPGRDPTGLLAACRALGLEPAIRWSPGHHAGPRAADILSVAARALAILGRKGFPVSGTVDLAPGWRSALADGIGHAALDRGLKEPGLTPAAAAALTGLAPGDLPDLVARGHLAAGGRGSVTLSSAIRVRDALERAGIVAWPADAFGAADLARLSAEPVARLFVAHHVPGEACGVAVARRCGADLEVTAGSHRIARPAPPHAAAAAEVVRAVARALDQARPGAGPPGDVEVVTTDAWLARLLGSDRHRDPGLRDALGTLARGARGRGLAVRSRLVRESLALATPDGEPMGLMLAAIAAAKVASATRGPYALRAGALRHGPGALLPSVRGEADGLADRHGRALQAAVTAALFDLVPGEGALRARFEALAAATHAADPRTGFVRRPILPGPYRDGLARVGDGAGPPRPAPGPDGPAGPLRARWQAWWADYAALAGRTPVLALREAVLRLDPEPDLARWPEAWHRAAVEWIAAAAPCPFPIPAGLRDAARAEIGPLLEACGGWPFARGRPLPAEAA